MALHQTLHQRLPRWPNRNPWTKVTEANAKFAMVCNDVTEAANRRYSFDVQYVSVTVSSTKNVQSILESVYCLLTKRNYRFAVHPSCAEMPSKMVKRVNEYAWQCSECKHCIKCRRTEDDDKMLFCDQCDRGYHIYCIGLRKVPNGMCHVVACLLSYDDSRGPNELTRFSFCIFQVNGIVRFVRFAQCAVHVAPKVTTIRI